MMDFIKITKNGTLLESSYGENKDIKNPIKIEFVIDESVYNKLLEATEERKWSIYGALSMMCEHSDDFIGEMECNSEKYFHAE